MYTVCTIKLSIPITGNTHFGTTTSRVTRYSELSTKSSFLTMSARLLVSRLPLVVSSSVSIIKMWLYWLFSTICLSLCPPAWEINLKVSRCKHASALSSWERGEMYRCTRCRGFLAMCDSCWKGREDTFGLSHLNLFCDWSV